MEDNGGDDTPFWLQSTAGLRRDQRIRREVSSFFFSSGLVVFLLLVAAVFLFVFVVPSTPSLSVQMFRPNSVKKSWDSLNIVLVLVAVAFGLLSRNKNEERDSQYDEFQPTPIKKNEFQKFNPSSPSKWYNYPTSDAQSSTLSTSVQWYQHSDAQHKLEYNNKNSLMRRNSSSYPDLREFPSLHYEDYYQRRFFDDINVDPRRAPDTGHNQIHHRRHRSMEDVDSFRAPLQTTTVIVDTLHRKSEKAVNYPLPPAPLQPTASLVSFPPRFEGNDTNQGTDEIVSRRKEKSKKKVKRDPYTLQRESEKAANSSPPSAPLQPPASPVSSPPLFKENGTNQGTDEIVSRRKETSRRKARRDPEFINGIVSTTSPPPPPPPSPPPLQKKSNKGEKKRDGATGSATKDFLNSLYHKKKKKQRQKSVDNLDSLLHEAQTPLTFQLPPQSTPPPPVFQNLFSRKKHKRTRTIKVLLTPSSQHEPNPNPQIAPLTTHRLAKPTKLNSFDKLDETSNSGGESPLSRIPPPPPPPPSALFKSPAWKFVVQGDYVRVNSNTSSRSGSPDPDELDSDVTPSTTDGGNITPFHPSPLFCPSPDVNTKADSFITNFRAKLQLEKIHSLKRRDLGPSTLGPKPSPSQI